MFELRDLTEKIVGSYWWNMLSEEAKQEKVKMLEDIIKENSTEDTTSDTFYDDLIEKGEKEGVCVGEFISEEFGIGYTIQIAYSNIWMPEEMFIRVGIGVEKAMEKIRSKQQKEMSA